MWYQNKKIIKFIGIIFSAYLIIRVIIPLIINYTYSIATKNLIDSIFLMSICNLTPFLCKLSKTNEDFSNIAGNYFRALFSGYSWSDFKKSIVSFCILIGINMLFAFFVIFSFFPTKHIISISLSYSILISSLISIYSARSTISKLRHQLIFDTAFFFTLIPYQFSILYQIQLNTLTDYTNYLLQFLAVQFALLYAAIQFIENSMKIAQEYMKLNKSTPKDSKK